MSLPDLPYMRPLAMNMPVVYESQLTYYEYLNNIAYYLSHTLRPYIDELLPLIDNFPVLKGRVDVLADKVASIENNIETIQAEIEIEDGKINNLTTLTSNHTNRLNTIDTQISDLAESVTDIVADINEINTELGELDNRIDRLEKRFALRKTTSMETGDVGFTLEDIFPSGVSYRDLSNKTIRIVLTLAKDGNIGSNQNQTITFVGDTGLTKQVSLSKASTSVTLNNIKSYCVDIDIKCTNDVIKIWVKPYGDATTYQWYGGYCELGNTDFTRNIEGVLAFNGYLGDGKVEVYY